MVIEEFISAYAEQEMRKKKHKEDQEAREAAGLPPAGTSPRAGGTKSNKKLMAVSDTRLSGTTRQKQFTESQLKNLQARGGVRVVNPNH